MRRPEAVDTYSRAVFANIVTSRHGNTRGSSIAGLSALVVTVRPTGTHSMRRTKAAQIYKKTGNLRAVQLLLGHTKLESTARYLGIEVDDALSISSRSSSDFGWLRPLSQTGPQQPR